MAPCLQDCPNEIVENVVLLLDLDDICSLRRSCRSLASKCTQGHFKSFFLSKSVEVSETTLRAFAEVTQPGMLGDIIRELTLIGVANSARGDNLGMRKLSREEEIELLSQAFHGLATNSESGRLPSLSLEVAVACSAGGRLPPTAAVAAGVEVDNKLVWQSAADTFNTTWHALAASNLVIERLNIFNSHRMQRCSLACDSLADMDWENPGLAQSFASIRSLSVSLSNRVIDAPESDEEEEDDYNEEGDEEDGENDDEDEDEYDGEGDGEDEDWKDNNQLNPISPKQRDENDLRAEAEDESNFVSLANLLQLCSQLNDFEIHYFRIHNAPLSDEELHHERHLQRIVERVRLPKLKCCRLRGVCAREEDLLTFIERAPICELYMENVDLCTGIFRDIFDYCLGESTSIQKIYFDDLFEQRRLIYFNVPGEPKFWMHGAPYGCSTLERRGDEVKDPVSYHIPQFGPIGSPAAYEWSRQQRMEYGHL